ncbi:MAG: hypothetical protein ACTSR8_10845 [Promethearchaeota archaeon]
MVKSKGIVVDVLFELSEVSVKKFVKDELIFLELCMTEASCEFEKRLIQKVSCMSKQYLDLLSSPYNLLNEKDLEDILRIIHQNNEKIECFKRITILN